MPKLGFLRLLQNEDHRGDAEAILQLIREKISMYPCEERVGRMRWGIKRMIKRLEGEGTEHDLKVAHHLWKRGHAMYPDYITVTDEPKVK